MGRDRSRSDQGGEVWAGVLTQRLSAVSPPGSASPRHPPHKGEGKLTLPSKPGSPHKFGPLRGIIATGLILSSRSEQSGRFLPETPEIQGLAPSCLSRG